MSRSATEVITAVESGETTRLMPQPNSTISGSTTNHRLWVKANNPSPRKLSATSSEPAAIIGPGPTRSDNLPAQGDSTVSRMPSGSSTSDTSAGVMPQPAISVIGR